jgi:hypothetical protein
MPLGKDSNIKSLPGFHFDEAVSEIVDVARDWLHVGHKVDTNAKATQQSLIEGLLVEISRLETLNRAAANEITRVQTEAAQNLRLSTAEECAVICETVDYVTRSYGCAREIRIRFGLPALKS